MTFLIILHTGTVSESSKKDWLVVDVKIPSLSVSYKDFKSWPGIGGDCVEIKINIQLFTGRA